MTQRRRSTVAFALVTLATVLVALVIPTQPAHATSYRYWTYWQGGSGDWTFSAQGAARRPADGSVEGWRFAISQSAGSSDTPRVSSTFAGICGDTAPVEGKKRIGLVLDFGVAADAPSGTTPPNGPIARCLVVPETATGYDVLVAATSIRTEGGLVCGIAGYPKSGCGEAVSDPKPTNRPDTGDEDGDGESGGKDGSDGSSGSNQPGGSASNGAPQSGSDQGTSDAQQPTASDNKSKSEKAKSQQQRDNSDEDQPQAPAPDTGGEPVEAAVALQADMPEAARTGSPWGAAAGAAVIAGLLAAGVVVARRRR